MKDKKLAYATTWFGVIAGIVALIGFIVNVAAVRTMAGIATADLFLITVAISWGGAYMAQRQLSRMERRTVTKAATSNPPPQQYATR